MSDQARTVASIDGAEESCLSFRVPTTAIGRGIVVSILFSGLWLAAPAQEAARTPIVDADPGTPGIGGGIRVGSGPYSGAETEFDLIPLYLFEGKWFYSHGTEMGLHLYRNKRFTFNVFARYRFLKLDPGDDPSLAGLLRREQTTEAGAALGFRGGWGALKLNWMADVQGQHEGQRLGLPVETLDERL